MEGNRDEDLFEPVKRKSKKWKPKDARKAELTAATTGSSTSSSRVAEPKRRSTACLRCLEEGHFIRECRNPVRCRYCRGEGHSKNSCPSLVSQSRSGTSAGARGGSFGSLPGGESANKLASSATSGLGKVSGVGGDSDESQRRSEPADEQASKSAASGPGGRSRTAASKTGAHARMLEEGGDTTPTEKESTDGDARTSTGIKRRRSTEGATGSGLTPAKKKWEASTSFSYASVSKGARSLVAHKEGTSVTSAERDELIDLFETSAAQGHPRRWLVSITGEAASDAAAGSLRAGRRRRGRADGEVVHRLGGRVGEGPVGGLLRRVQEEGPQGALRTHPGRDGHPQGGATSALPAGVGEEEGRAGHGRDHQDLPDSDGFDSGDRRGAGGPGQDG